jgi:hypothetical protein
VKQTTGYQSIREKGVQHLEAVDKACFDNSPPQGAGGIHCRRKAPERACLYKARLYGVCHQSEGVQGLFQKSTPSARCLRASFTRGIVMLNRSIRRSRRKYISPVPHGRAAHFALRRESNCNMKLISYGKTFMDG